MSGCIALILAGGSGTRLGGGRPKQYLTLSGKPLVRHSVESFIRHPAIEGVRLVIGRDDRPAYEKAMDGLDLLDPVVGGADRQQSGLLGLESLEKIAPAQVLIHDAARPFVSARLIERVVDAIARSPGALPALPVVDTLKRATVGARVGRTVDRAGLWRAQTPQGFRFADILAAHQAASGKSLTDDAAIAEQAGLDVALVDGDEDNIKVTTMADLERAERYLAARQTSIRTATGFDVHRFGAGDAVMLCGVSVPHDRGLEGHSDADAGLHALTDALLGTIAAGDIGMHFPPRDDRWRDAGSDIFLGHAVKMIRDRGGNIENVDVTLICERPKVGPHRDAMRQRVAEILGIEIDRVSVKATTTEGLGFTGRGEGIAAQASASVSLPETD